MPEPRRRELSPPDVREILFSAERIGDRVRELGAVLSRDYAAKDPLLVGILTGSFTFIADLVRAMDIPLEVDFMAVSSYGKGTQSSGVVKILKDLDRPIEARHVVLVEDIVDSGLTLGYLRDNLSTRGPSSLALCALLDKRAARTRPLDVDYVGFACPDAFVVGYGLDHAGRHRNLPYIGAIAPPPDATA